MDTSEPLAIELFAGSCGWGSAFAAEGWRVVAFDIEHLPHHGPVPAGCELVLQDVATLHGAQFRNADAILASPPCQGYSARAMPWARLRDKMLLQHMGWEDDGGPPFDSPISNPPIDNTLFRHTLRIHREACEAAERYIPLLIENVKGAQRWVGSARWHYGSFYLWGDVPALMPHSRALAKVPGLNWSGSDKPGYKAEAFNTTAEKRIKDGLKWGDCNGKRFDERPKGNVAAHREGSKNNGGSWFAIGSPGQTNVGQNPDGRAVKGDGGEWFQGPGKRGGNKARSAELDRPQGMLRSNARKAASAQIARIPPALARHIAQCFKPE